MSARCLWCGQPSTTERRAARDVMVPVCDTHSAMIDRNLRARELETSIKTLTSRLKHGNCKSPDAAERELERMRLELRQLRNP